MSKMRFGTMDAKVALAGLVALTATTMPALAGMPVPAPLAGVVGPYGLLAAGVAYGCYRAVKFFRARR
jgi:hypothetical protein